MYYTDKKNSFQMMINPILKHLDTNQKHYLDNPKQLSYLMKEYNLLCLAGAYHPKKPLEFCNPKDPITVFQGEFKNKVFEAWGYWTREEYEFLRSGKKLVSPLAYKLNKTFEEFVAEKLDHSVFSHKMFFNNEATVTNYIFNVHGTGCEWNEAGYLVESNGDGTEWSATEELNQELMEVLDFKKDPDYLLGIQRYNEYVEKTHTHSGFILQNLENHPDPKSFIENILNLAKEKHNGTVPEAISEHLNMLLDNALNPKFLPYYAGIAVINEYSLIATMPENVHPSYTEAAIKWCEHMLSEPSAHENHIFAEVFLQSHKA